MKKVCKNSLCGKMFEPMSRGSKTTKYCSLACSDVGRAIRNGCINIIDDFDKGRKGFIKLRNGVNVRNDAVGKEISGQLLVVSRW